MFHTKKKTRTSGSGGNWDHDGKSEYAVFRVSGPEHHPVFEVEVRLHKFVARGEGPGRRAAESAAAANLLRYFKRAGL